MHDQSPRLALGPIQYFWSREAVFSFYGEIADSDIDIVYLGETVCSKRRQLRTDDWLELADRLAASGKEVVLSTLALIEAESELRTLRRICTNGRYLVEANDMGAANLLDGSPFVTGPSVNIYNARTLSLLAASGLRRWVLPVELSAGALADIQAERPNGVETEVLIYGRLPLALSARCFTARAHHLPKDDCEFRCLDDPDGMVLATQDDTRFLSINGVQTQSAQTLNLIREFPTLRDLGVDVLRVSPQSQHTPLVIELIADCIRGRRTPEQTSESLERLAPTQVCDGYWHGEPGMWRHAIGALAQ